MLSNDFKIEGRNPVMEALKSGKEIDKIYIAKGETQGSIIKIKGIAKEKGVLIVETDRKKLDEMESQGLDNSNKLDKYGLPRDLIQLERENLERSRNKLLGEDHSR